MLQIFQALSFFVSVHKPPKTQWGKINICNANKHSNKLHTAVSVAFSVPSSVESKNWWKTALIYSFTVDATEGGGTKG